ncbi:unnamed protein product [Arctogadus glacialis]
MEGQVAAPHPKGLEAAEVLEATAGLEVEANLEGLEAAVGSNLEGPAVASTWRRSAWRARRRRRRPGGPGGGVGGLEGPAAASAAWRARRRRPGGPGGGVGGLEGPEAAAPHPAVGPVEVLEEMVPAVEDGWGIRRWRFNKVDLSFRRLKGRPDVRQLGVMVQRPNAALNYTSVSYSP